MHAPLNVVRFNLGWEKIQGDYLDAELLESPVVLSSQAGFNLLIEPFFPERETTFNGDGFNRRLFNQSIFRSPLISATYFNSSADGDILLEGLPDTAFSFSTLSGEGSIIYHESGQSEAGATFTVVPNIVIHEIFHDAVSTFSVDVSSGNVIHTDNILSSLFNSIVNEGINIDGILTDVDSLFTSFGKINLLWEGFIQESPVFVYDEIETGLLADILVNSELRFTATDTIISGRVLGQRIYPYPRVITQTEGDADRIVDAGINILPVVYGELGRGDLIYQAVNLVSASSFFSQLYAQKVYDIILAGHEIGSVFTIDMLISDYFIEIPVYMFGPEHLQTIKHGSYDLDVVKYEPEVIKVIKV